MHPLSLRDFGQLLLPDRGTLLSLGSDWQDLPSGSLVLYDAEGAVLQLSWHRASAGAALLTVCGGLRSWSALLRSRDEDLQVQANALRAQLEAYLTQHAAPFSRTVKARVALARRARAVMGARVPLLEESEICRPPGHTCPAIDGTQSILRRIGWRVRKPPEEDDLAAIRGLIQEGRSFLERVRAENAEMRAAYWSMHTRLSMSEPTPTTKETP